MAIAAVEQLSHEQRVTSRFAVHPLDIHLPVMNGRHRFDVVGREATEMKPHRTRGSVDLAEHDRHVVADVSRPDHAMTPRSSAGIAPPGEVLP